MKNAWGLWFSWGTLKLESTVRYLGIEVDNALSISEQVELRFRP